MRLPALDQTRAPRRAAAMAAGVGLAAVTAAALGGAPAASGSAAPAGSAAALPALPAGGGECSAWSATQTVCEFSYVGASRSFVVPAWQTELGFEATGADGGSGLGAAAGPGGKGAVATVERVRFNAGERLVVSVGGRPADGVGTGGWNGGGAGGAGAGGGATDVRRAPYGSADRLIVAGGGGGGGTRHAYSLTGDPGAGGAGGWRNGVGSASAGDAGIQGYEPFIRAGGGLGGGASSSGAGGSGSPGVDLFGCPESLWPFSSGYPHAGDSGVGAAGGLGGYIRSSGGLPCSRSNGFGGGGGGGYFGGGGGGAGFAAGAGGGGGSSFGPPGVVFTRSTSARAGLNVGVPAPAGWRNDSVRVKSGTHVASPVAASTRAGGTDIFYLDTTGAALHTRVPADGSMREDRIGVLFAPGTTPASVSRTPGSIDLFGRGRDNTLWRTSWDGGSWSTPSRIGTPGLLVSSPTVTSWGPSRLDVFGRGPGGYLLHYWSDNAGATWRWEELGDRPLSGHASAVSWGPNRIDVLSVDASDVIQHMSWNGSEWTNWIRWADPDRPLLGSEPTISSRGPGQLNIVVRDQRGDLVGRRFENDTWSWWQPLAAVPARPGEKPALVTRADGSMSVLVRGELEDGLWTRSLTWSSSPW